MKRLLIGLLCGLTGAALAGENVRVYGGYLDVSATNVLITGTGLDISKGLLTGHTYINKFGNAPDFDTTDGQVTVWDGANDTAALSAFDYTYSTSADIDSIVSTSAGDGQVVEVQGLGAATNLVVQNVTLNGQTRVALSTNLLRVFRMKNIGATDLAGNVSCYVTNSPTASGVVSAAGDVRALILGNNNQTEMALYTIPTGKTGYLNGWYAATAGANRSSNYIMEAYVRPPGQVFQLKLKIAIADDGTSQFTQMIPQPGAFAAGTDIEIRTKMTAAGATAGSVTAGFYIILVDD